MTMPCRITDEDFFNPWEGEETFSPDERTINDLTVAELMGDDHSVWLGKNKEFGYILEIENDEGQTIIEKCIHPYAAESLAGFCRRYLSFYEKLEAA
jgi:hypothetical protein